MASIGTAHIGQKEANQRSHRSDETTLIVLAALSVKNRYYRSLFDQIIDYMANFAHLVNGKDEIVILADAATLPYFRGKVADNILIEANIEDIWIRDFSPVVLSQQIKFRYLPNYLSKSDAYLIDSSFEKWIYKNYLSYKRKSNIILDGGNVVDNANGSRLIVTSRILKDNPQLTKSEAKSQLKYLTSAHEVAIIPEISGDTTGHSDGMVMWASNNKILLYEAPEPQRTQIIRELEMSFVGVQIVEIPDYYQYAT